MTSLLYRDNYIDQAEGRATAIRQELGLGSDSLGDIFELLSHLDIDVVRWPMEEDGPDGFYMTTNGLAVIMVNSSKRLSRQRFTACHELAHHLFDQESLADSDIFAGKSDAERRANAFAAYFLMPGEGVRRWLVREGLPADGLLNLDAPSVVHLAHHFGMSYEATLYHLRDLGRLRPKAVAQLKLAQPEKIARRLGYDVDAEELERERKVLPPGFVRLALQAYGSGDVSPARLAELLRTDEGTAELMAEEAGLVPPELSLEDLAGEARNA